MADSLKRVFEVCFSAVALVVCVLPLAVLCIVIRLGSKGSPIFSQTRVGRHERPFQCLKLRTMFQGTGDKPSHAVSEQQITPIGRVLRKLKLDELPQLWNVLAGDLSLVGPRPCLPSQHELIAARRAGNVFSVRPGITGLAQVHKIDMSNPERLARIDIDYVNSQSLWGDIKILLATFKGVGHDPAAADKT
jgi:O-antigen biosynthesis protein WbqP